MEKITTGSGLVGILLILSLLACTGCTPQVSDTDVSFVAAEDVAVWLGKGDEARLVIDVRNAESYAAARIEGAEHFALPDLSDSRHTEYFSRHKTIVLYGDDAGSARATAGAKRLLSLGYRDVRVLQGGLDAWRARGLPIAK